MMPSSVYDIVTSAAPLRHCLTICQMHGKKIISTEINYRNIHHKRTRYESIGEVDLENN